MKGGKNFSCLAANLHVLYLYYKDYSTDQSAEMKHPSAEL